MHYGRFGTVREGDGERWTSGDPARDLLEAACAAGGQQADDIGVVVMHVGEVVADLERRTSFVDGNLNSLTKPQNE